MVGEPCLDAVVDDLEERVIVLEPSPDHRKPAVSLLTFGGVELCHRLPLVHRRAGEALFCHHYFPFPTIPFPSSTVIT